MKKFRIIMLMGMVCFVSIFALAQKKVPHGFQYQADASGEGVLKEVTQVNYPGTSSIRLYFDEVQLGPNSYLLLEGSDGASQKLDSKALENWNNSSAYFNGQHLKVSVYQAAGETVTLKLKELKVNDRAGNPQTNQAKLAGSPDTQSHNTVELPPYAAAVGRFTDGAEARKTCWIAANGAIVSHAPGHSNPDLDGGVQYYDHVEFNVPPSNPDGTINHAAPEDQYPLNHNHRIVRSIKGEKVVQGPSSEFSNGHGGHFIEVKKYEGLDRNKVASSYMIIEALPNGTGKRPGERIQEYFQVVDHPNGPAMEGQMLEIFHYGIVEGHPTNQTLQTRLLEAEDPRKFVRNVDDRDIFLTYNHGTSREGFWNADMYGAPIAFQGTNVVAGVHLEGFSDSPSLGFGFRDEVFRQDLSDFFSADVTYVDRATELNVASGEIDKPYAIVSAGATYVADHGTVSIARGSYNESLTIDRPMTLKAPVGVVKIGTSEGNSSRTGQTLSSALFSDRGESVKADFEEKTFEVGSLFSYPNPFSERTELRYSLPEDTPVIVKVFDILGNEVATLVETSQPAGAHEVTWDGRNHGGKPVGTGMYLMRLQRGTRIDVVRIIKQ